MVKETLLIHKFSCRTWVHLWVRCYAYTLALEACFGCCGWAYPVAWLKIFPCPDSWQLVWRCKINHPNFMMEFMMILSLTWIFGILMERSMFLRKNCTRLCTLFASCWDWQRDSLCVPFESSMGSGWPSGRVLACWLATQWHTCRSKRYPQVTCDLIYNKINYFTWTLVSIQTLLQPPL